MNLLDALRAMSAGRRVRRRGCETVYELSEGLHPVLVQGIVNGQGTHEVVNDNWLLRRVPVVVGSQVPCGFSRKDSDARDWEIVEC